MSLIENTHDLIQLARKKYISSSVDAAISEISNRRKNGIDVCDVSHIQGAMREAAMQFDNRSLC